MPARLATATTSSTSTTSTASTASTSAVHAAPAPVPDYRLRRLGAAVVVVCSLWIAMVAASATVDAVRGLGGRPAAASETARSASSTPSTYVAAPGDTLWSIADRFRGEVEIGRYVDALIDRNGGTTIRAGQAVVLP